MRQYDAGGGIGSDVEAARFVSPGKLEVVRDLDAAKPVLQRIRAVEINSAELSFASVAAKEAEIAELAGYFVNPRWGGLEPLRFSPDKELNVSEDLSVRGTSIHSDIFSDSRKARILRSVVSGGNVLSRAQSPTIESSILTGRAVLGGGPASNTQEFDIAGLQTMIDLADGIHENDRDKVKIGLTNLNDIVKSYDKEVYGKYEDENIGLNDDYTDFGTLQRIAVVFDSFLLPTFQHGETTNVTVNDSIIAGRYVARQILGGDIVESAVASSNPFDSSHVRLRDTFVLSSDNAHEGGEFVKERRIGDPERAEDLVALTAELPERPLAAFNFK